MAKKKLNYEQDMDTEIGSALGGNWVAIRRGLLEHIQHRDLNNREGLCLMVIILLADSKTGCWWGNAPMLSQVTGGVEMDEVAAQKVLRSLGKKGYVRSLYESGSRGSFPIVVNKYRVTSGNSSGRLICAAKTTNWRRPELYPVTDGVTEDVGDPVGEVVTPYSIPNTEYGRNDISVSVSASATLSHPSDERATGDTPVLPHTGTPRDPTGEVSPAPSPAETADLLLSVWHSVAPKRTINRPEVRQWLEQGHSVEQEASIVRWLFITSHSAEESPNYKGEFAIRSFHDYCKHYARIKNQWARYMEKKQAGEERAAEKLAAREEAKRDHAGDALSIWQKHTTMPGEKEDFADILREIDGENFADEWHLEDVIVAYFTKKFAVDVAVNNSADFKRHFRILERPVLERPLSLSAGDSDSDVEEF
jgi:hypothetical protein